MSDHRPLIERMHALVQKWEAVSDRRSIFLSCYLLMTRNMAAAVDADEFTNSAWVSTLIHRFADYYFDALEAYERDSPATQAVWRQVHDAASNPETLVLQNLQLGINAHINYDLVLTLVDMLEPEWAALSDRGRNERYADYCYVNQIIGRTVDIVQDTVVERLAPKLDIADKMLGPIDEWIVSQLLTSWRDEVWSQGVRLIQLSKPSERETLRQQIETTALKRAKTILLKNTPFINR
ncbi:MAG: hypothetical protein JSV81_20280 [Anaerolineales bacterium]|nr:MAG: hypothetical protein JSV81_20280 [Anaerolineales bacterium]